MKKEILAPGNIVLGANREITLIELRGQFAIDTDGNSWPYEKLDGILITPELLIKDGFTTRTFSTPKGQKTDYVKLVTVTDTDFFTVVMNRLPSNWKLEIFDKNHQQVGLGNIVFWNTLQNLTTAYVFG